MMRVYGLTGGIGTGKTTVSALLAEKGAVIVDADAIAREIVAPGSEGLASIVQAFGEGVLDTTGRLNRDALAKLVFSDEAKRKQLEGLTHPRIVKAMAERIAAAGAANAQVVILDVPLLYETGNLIGAVEKVIVVYAPADLQVERVISRNDFSPEHVRARMDAQMDIEEKKRRADYLIDNSGDLESTRRQVDALWDRLAGSSS